MERDLGAIRELDPADLEAIEAYGPKSSLKTRIDRRFFENEKTPALSAEAKGVDELTSSKGTPIATPYGAEYVSHDFRDHPELEAHLSALSAAWGDPSHESHKTLQVLRRLVSRREEATRKTSRRVAEVDLDYEVAWRRVAGNDVFIMGFTHGLDCYEANRGFYRDILSHSGMLITEGLQTVRLGYSMLASWDMPEESVFGTIMRDAHQLNPQILYGDNDPRDETEVILDELELDQPHLPTEYLGAFYAHLQKVSPSVARKLKSPLGLKAILQAYAHDSLGRLSGRKNFLSNGALYGPFPHLDLDSRGNVVLSEERTGLELGGLTNRDAVSAWTLRKVMGVLTHNNVKLDGPIVDIQGAQHVDNKVYFFDHPAEAYVNIRRQPQFAFLPDRGKFSADSFVPPWSPQNQRRIAEMVSSGIFNLHSQKDNPPQGFYKTNGFAFGRVVEGRMTFVQPW